MAITNELRHFIVKLLSSVLTPAFICASLVAAAPIEAKEVCYVDGVGAPCEVISRRSKTLKWLNTGKIYVFTPMPGHGSWQQGAMKVKEPNGNIGYGSYVHEGPMQGGTYIVQYKGSTIVFKG
jgi:hypothetical protein